MFVEGVKDIGKTFLIKKIFAGSYFSLDEENILEMIKLNPNFIFESKRPIFIDEWQIYPTIFNLVKRQIDEKNENGMFLLSGSSTPKKNVNILHSGAGRFMRIRMLPLTLTELNISTRKINLEALFTNKQLNSSINEFIIAKYIDIICKGGRTRLNDITNIDICIKKNINYIENIIDKTNDEKNITKQTLIKILKSLSRNISQNTDILTISKDAGISETSAKRYLNFLEECFLYSPLEVWNTHIRSTIQLRTKPKIHLVDPCFAVASLNLNEVKLQANMNYLGLVFESLVIRDLRTYSEYLNYKIYYYRDNSNLEIDCIIENNNDEIIAIEIKLGSDVGIAEGIKSLNRFKNKISDQSKIKSLNIITAQNKTYTTVEGINIISFGDLYVDF